MSEPQSLEAIRALFAPADAMTHSDGSRCGFPLTLVLNDGSQIEIETPEPAFFNHFDPDDVGLLVVDHLGCIRARWGLAAEVPLIVSTDRLLATDLGLMVQSALRGSPGGMYLDGYRYFASAIEGVGAPHIYILILNSSEEQAIRRQSERNHKAAELLRHVGKALTWNQNWQHLCGAAVYAIASAAELSAVLLWVAESDGEPMKLVAHVGVNRNSIAILQTLHHDREVTCMADLVASTRREMRLRSVNDNVMTKQLEAQVCYLKPGGLHVMPLTIGDKVLGVLELIAREGDADFYDQHELYKTIAEHLALAINTTVSLEQAESLAKFDPLTGISNHREMHSFLAQRVIESSRTGQSIGVIMVDVDHFRTLNEEEGHDLGDYALRQVARVLKDAIRDYDCAARYGGEEFAVIMPGSSMKTTVQIAKRIRKMIEEVPILTASGVERHITASLGCAVFPESAKEAAGLLKAADSAMFDAKRAGRNQVKEFEGELSTDTQRSQVDFEAIDQWLDAADRRNGTRLRKFTDPLIEPISEQLRLSKSQEMILRGMLKLYPRFRRAVDDGDQVTLQKLERVSELRTVLPALGAWDERFDGGGPRGLVGARLPLLTRIAQVLVACADTKTKPFESDPDRFDPQIVAIVREQPRAA